LNAATAGGFLGGAVEVTITPTSCDFVRQHWQLRIEVHPADAPHVRCESGGEALKGIGNEAQTCAWEGKNGWRGEQVSGRVRDQVFLVRISTDDPTAAAKSVRDKTRNLSEQVAGILF
jgi:hypothetical protein